MEDTFNGEKLDINDDVMKQATGGDGTLPGGMPPDVLQNLSKLIILSTVFFLAYFTLISIAD